MIWVDRCLLTRFFQPLVICFSGLVSCFRLARWCFWSTPVIYSMITVQHIIDGRFILAMLSVYIILYASGNALCMRDVLLHIEAISRPGAPNPFANRLTLLRRITLALWSAFCFVAIVAPVSGPDRIICWLLIGAAVWTSGAYLASCEPPVPKARQFRNLEPVLCK